MARTERTRERTKEEDERDRLDLSLYGDWLARLKKGGWFTRLADAVPPRLRRAPRWPDGALAYVGGLVVAVVLGLWLSAPAWGGRPPGGEDTMAHLSRARFAIDNLITHGRVDGWDPTFILGYQEFLFIGPGFTWAVFAVRTLSLGLLSTTGAFKVVVLGSFVLLPLAVAFFARSLGLSRRSAALAAILTLAVNSPFGGVGLQGLFNVGLVTHQFGAFFFFLALGGVLRVLEDPRPRWVVFTSATLGGLLMSHGISVIVLGAVLAIVVVLASVTVPDSGERRLSLAAVVRREVRSQLRELGLLTEDRTDTGKPDDAAVTGAAAFRTIPWRRLALAGLGAAGLAACTFLPFLAHRDLRGGFTGWPTPAVGARLAQIWRGEILFRPGVAVLVLAGLVYGLYRAYEGRRLALAVALAAPVYLVVAHAAFSQWPSNVAAFQLPNRGLGYAGVLAILPLAALVARVTRRFGSMGDLLAVAAAVGIVVLPLGATRDQARQTPEPVPAMREAARQLAARVPDGARFVTERFFPTEISRTRLVNPDRWLAWAAGRNTLNNFNVESSVTGAAAYQSESIRDRSPAEVADAVSRLGVTHLVTVSDEAAQRMATSDRFRREWAGGPLAIFRVLPRSGQPDPAALVTAPSPLQARLADAAPEHLIIDVETTTASSLDVAVAWSPKWHATVDGRSVPVRRAADGLIRVEVPAGRHQLKLDFRLDVWDFAGIVLSLLTVGLGARWLWRGLLRRKSERSRSSAAEPGGDAPVPTSLP